MCVEKGKSHLHRACILRCFEEKDWVSEIPSFVVSCRHRSLSLFSLIPALQHWLSSHQMENMPPETQHPTRQPYTTASCQERGPESTTYFLYEAAATRLKHVGWALPTAPQHCYGLQGKGCNSHYGQLEHPVAAGHHNFGRLGLPPSLQARKPRAASLTLAQVLMTQGGICCLLCLLCSSHADSVPLYPTAGSWVAFNLTLQQEKGTRQVSCSY